MRMLKKKVIRGCAVVTVVLGGAILLGQALAVAQPPNKAPITEDQVNAAQQAWCDAIVKIGKVYEEGGDYEAVASELINDLYDFDEGKVFFRPTLASGEHAFRSTKEGALSYFIGGNANFPNDNGFALYGWEKCDFDNNAAENGIQIHGDVAVTMGNVYLTNRKGEVVTVDKTFVFRRGSDGKLRLCAHKSALPNDPGK